MRHRRDSSKIGSPTELLHGFSNQLDTERINLVKDRLLALCVGILSDRNDSEEPKGQMRRIQEEISIVIWMLEDWQIQMTSRN